MYAINELYDRIELFCAYNRFALSLNLPPPSTLSVYKLWRPLLGIKWFKMAIRDSSAARLQLAFVFWDEDVMIQMLNNLKDYPLSDSSLPRLHNRLCFVGLAAYALGARQGCEAYVKLKQDVSGFEVF